MTKVVTLDQVPRPPEGAPWVIDSAGDAIIDVDDMRWRYRDYQIIAWMRYSPKGSPFPWAELYERDPAR